MPIEPVKIPQNVYIEDRIVGPLTLRQIIIMAVGGGFSYMMYASVQKTMGHVGIPLTIVLWAPAVVAAAFALVKFNDLSLMRICFLLLERLNKPAIRTFAPRQGISITIRTSWFPTPVKDEKKKNQEEKKQQDAHRNLRELSTIMDRAPEFTAVAPAADADVQASGEPMAAAGADAQAPVAADRRAAAESDPRENSEPIQGVDPTRVKTDAVAPQLQTPELSDLSVFRDILPPQAPWH